MPYNPDEPRDWRGRWAGDGDPPQSRRPSAADVLYPSMSLLPEQRIRYSQVAYAKKAGAASPPDNDQGSGPWRQEGSVGYEQGHSFTTNGPIKIEVPAPIFQPSQAWIRVQWFPLDEKGKVVPVITTPEHAGPKEYGVGSGMPLPIDPPFPNKYGFRVEVTYPPQERNSRMPGRASVRIWRKD